MDLYIAAYKGDGRWIDRLTRLVLSIRHRTKVPYSHVELLPYPPQQITPESKTLVQQSLAASKRDGSKVRLKPEMVFKKGHWDFVKFPASGMHNEWTWNEAKAAIGTPYDTIGAILCVTPFARLSMTKDWCSGLLADIAGWDDPQTFDPYMVVQKCLQEGGELVEG